MITNHVNEDFDAIDTDELAERWKGKWSARTLANWRSGDKKRGPPFYRMNGKVVYKLHEVIEWEQRQHCVPDPDPNKYHV